MSYAGDFALGSTIDVKFTTRRFATGAPFTLAGTPVISAYPDNSTTQLTAGITLTVDFDTVTGLHNVRVVATSGNGYAAGTSYYLVITTGTVDSVSVVGEVIGSFTLARGAALTAGVVVATNNDKTGYALTAGERTSVADALLDRDMSTGTDSGSATVRTVRQALRFIRNKWSIAAGTLTVTKEDDTTTSWTAAVTTAAGNPVSEVDPASS